MIYELVAFGGFVFWTIVALGIVVAVLVSKNQSVSDGKLGATIWVVVLFSGFLYGFSDFPVIDLQRAVYALACYIAFGLIWASSRWYFFLKGIRDFVVKNNTLSRKELDERLWRDYDNRNWPPSPSEHSSRLWFWSVFWPLDLLGETISGPLNWVYDRFVLVFSSISKRMFGGIDLPEKEDPRSR